jgi:hypothetical protein
MLLLPPNPTQSALPAVPPPPSPGEITLRIVIAISMRRFRFELVQHRKLDRVISIVLAPSPGLYMRLHAPDRAFSRPTGPRRGNLWRMVALD